MGPWRADFFKLGGEIRAIGNAKRAWRDRWGFWLRLRDPDGHSGWGEATPLPGYSRESLEEVQTVLEAWTSKSKFRGSEEFDGLEAMASLPPVASARFAIETAWLDLVARRRGEPLPHLLGAESTAPVPVATLITELDPEKAVAQAQAAEGRGLRHFKFKIGRPGQWRQEVEVLRALRQPAQNRILRLDANGTLPVEDLHTRLGQLAEFSPEFVEEPVAFEELARLAAREPHAALDVPLALDESLQDPKALERLRPWLEAGVFRAWVLKPTALGGLRACLDLARQAQTLGIATLVSHCFDGPVALAAAAALALALPGERLACGLDPHPALAAWPKIEQPSLIGGRIEPSDRPGLGIEVAL